MHTIAIQISKHGQCTLCTSVPKKEVGAQNIEVFAKYQALISAYPLGQISYAQPCAAYIL